MKKKKKDTLPVKNFPIWLRLPVLDTTIPYSGFDPHCVTAVILNLFASTED